MSHRDPYHNELSRLIGGFRQEPTPSNSLAHPPRVGMVGPTSLGLGLTDQPIAASGPSFANPFAAQIESGLSLADDTDPTLGNALARMLPVPELSLGQALAAALVTPAATPTPLPWSWYYVRPRFGAFLENLEPTDWQREDAETKRGGVTASLNRAYFGHSSRIDNAILIGSWGKGTAIRPPPDADLIYLLPNDVYWRYEARLGNRQSQLLQEVKAALSVTYPQTTIRGDGQVVLIPFNTTTVEVSLGFRCRDGSIIVVDANDGGRYVASTSAPEIQEIAASDRLWNGNTRHLIQMAKQWARENNVPLRSFEVERLAIEFLRQWPFRGNGLFWYDWLIRDFFAYMISRPNTWLIMPGTGETVWLGNEWLTKAQRAYSRAVTACNYEYQNYGILAGDEWRAIFGSEIPLTP